MKKIFLSLVFLFGVGTFVMADDTMKVKNDTVTVEDGFKNIDLKEVPQSVKDAIAKKYPESTLKSASLSLKNRHKAQRKAKFYLKTSRSASWMQSGEKQISA